MLPLRPSRSLVPILLLLGAIPAHALEVIPVPWVATDPAVPHLAYNGHATIFKAIARGGDGTYLVDWDFDGDGTYDATRTTTDRYDLSATSTYPAQAADTTFHAVIRVTSGPEVAYGTYPVRVFADVPADPALTTDRQLQVMRSVAIDDGLWFLHTQMGRAGDETHPLTGAQLTGWVDPEAGQPSARSISSASFLEALGRNLHFAAFPAAYLGAMPDPAANAARWNTDPYAEDAARLVNHLLGQATVVAVAAADESNLTGFYPEVSAPPIAGTDDGFGIHVGYSPGELTNGPHSNFLRALALARLDGYVAQVGDPNRILGRSFEHVAQQMVDALVWAQNEGGVMGSWYYGPNGVSDMLGEFAGGALDAAEALWQVERSLSSRGVIVPNLVKARLANYIAANANACPTGGTGGSWSTAFNGGCDFALSAAHLLTLGWLGGNAASPADTRFAFPSYNSMTFGQLRAQYDSTLTFITSTFNGTSFGQYGWDIGFVDAADYARIDGRGNHWSMLHWTRAARAVAPEIVLFGTNDHARLFGRYLVANQAASGGWTWALASGTLNNNNDYYLGSRGRAAWALDTLSREGMAPVASARASAATIGEGATVALDGDAFAGEATYHWDLGNGQTAQGRHVDYAYPDNGVYPVTLTVTTPAGTSTHATSVTVTNVAPSVAVPKDFTVPEGTGAAVVGVVTDPGSADTDTVEWTFGDGATAATATAVHAYADQGAYTATLTATDDDGGSASASLTVTVVNVAPTITSVPAATHAEGGAYGYTLAFTDPGTSDVHACSAPVMPSGATLTGCTLSWTPTFAQLTAPAAVTMCVDDGDGGSACQSFTITVTPVDADADGLPDAWEVHYFGSIAGQTAATDSDLDGATNGDELLAGTDPTSWEGPGLPVLLAPSCASTVATLRPSLLVANAVHPRGAPLTYEFEVYSDEAATTLVAAGRDVPGGLGFTAWQVGAPLVEDTRYYWRARASAGAVSGAWTTPTCALTVDATPAPPPTPTTTSGSGSGCGCSGAGAAPWPTLGFVLVALLWKPRRCRRAGGART